MKTMSIPAYYRDKQGREEATAYLETIIRQIMDMIVLGQASSNLNQKVADLFTIDFKPKCLGDTGFGVVSRFHVAIAAMQIWQMKYATGKECELLHTSTISMVENFLTHTYIPYCKTLQIGIFHKYSNHGALGLMGECIARKYLAHHGKEAITKAANKRMLRECVYKLEKRIGQAVLDKSGLWGNRHELWVENLRNKKGLFYTHLHLSALIRAMVTLGNEKIIVSDKKREELHNAYQRYLYYFYDPQNWPHMDATKIPVLRQLQKLIFPADEFIAPRIDGKEGAFVDVCSNRIYTISSPPFMSQVAYKELGAFPYSTYIMASPYNLWKLL